MDTITFDPELYDTLYEFSQISKKNDEKIKEIIENSTFKLPPAITEAIDRITKEAFENLKINAEEIIKSVDLTIPDSQFQKIGQIQAEAWQAAVKAIEPAMESFNKRFKELELESNAVLDKEATDELKETLQDTIEEIPIIPEQKKAILNFATIKKLFQKEDWNEKEKTIVAQIVFIICTLITILYQITAAYTSSKNEKIEEDNTTIIQNEYNTTNNNYYVLSDEQMADVSSLIENAFSLPDDNTHEKDDSHEQDADSLQSDSDSSFLDDSEDCDQEKA